MNDYSLVDVNSVLNQIMIEFTKRENKIKELQHEIQEIKDIYNRDLERRSVNKSVKPVSSNYAYEIDKDTFVNSINSIKVFKSYLNKLSNVGLNLYDVDAIVSMEDSFKELLAKCCNDREVSPYIGKEIDYFIYELDFGEKWTETSFTDGYDNPIDISTIEKFWDYIYNTYIKNFEGVD